MAEIPVSEYRDRVKRLQAVLRERELDAYVVYSNEADFANVRYLSNYWPLFEVGGVLVPAEGEPTLLIGPESGTYAEGRSTIERIRKMVCFRESAEPDYPGIKVSDFAGVFKEACGTADIRRLGLGSHAIFPQHVYAELKAALPNTEILYADDIITGLRAVKSENEVACLREAARISQVAWNEVVPKLRPGLTELQVVGMVLEVLYREGAEYEGFPQYILAAKHGSHAIGRAGYTPMKKGDLVIIGTGARVCGYASSCSRPVCFGEMTGDMRRLVEFGYEAHDKTVEMMAAGVPASEVAVKYEEFLAERGFRDYMLYGPCHGLGLIEVERPWMETTSDYLLQKNMTFEVDTFFYTEDYGLRWEDGVRVTADGVDKFTWPDRAIIEIT